MSSRTADRPRWSRLLFALCALSLLAAACGGDDDDEGEGPDETGEEEASVDENGVLRLAAGLQANTSGTQFADLNKLQSPASPIHQIIYDTLLRALPDGSYEPAIATKAEVADPSTIEVTIREGVKFNDGSPLTPDDVVFSILRHRDAKNVGAFAVELEEISDVTASGQVVTIKLKTPIAGIFYQYLGRGETMVESKKAIESGTMANDKPVAAGPYVIDSLAIENKLVLKKNPNYYDADKVRIPTVEYTNVSMSDPQATVNGLRSHAFDAADNLQKDQIDSLQGSGLKTKVEVTPSTLLWGQLCKKDAPYSDVRVRQALNYALDREQIDEVIYGGESEPQWGFWPEGHPFHNEEMTGYYERDVAKAKKLLADAGFANGFSMDVVNIAGITQTANEMIKAQWAEIGVTVNPVGVQNLVQDFFIDGKAKMFFFPLQRAGLDRITRTLVPGSVGDVCQWDNSELNDLVAKLRAVPQTTDSEEAIELWHELEELTVTEAHNIFGLFGTSSNIWDDSKIGDVEFIVNFQGIPILDIRDAYIKA